MERIIVKDLTLQAVRKKAENAENAEKVENVRRYNYREGSCMKPQEKIAFLARNFDRFLVFNPEYMQTGTLQFAMSATKDVGAYQIGNTEYLDDMLVSRTPVRGARYFVASLGEARNCASAHRRFQRCLCSETYFVTCDENGLVSMEKLLNNNDWLIANRVDYAFEIVVKKLGGMMAKKQPQWVNFSYAEIKDFGRVGFYTNHEGQSRLILCMANSGTILTDISEEEISLTMVEWNGEFRSVVNQVLRFKMLSDNLIVRVSADNVNAFIKNEQLQDL